MEKTLVKITGNMNGSSMGDGWKDVDEANSSFVDRFIERMENLFAKHDEFDLEIDVSARSWEVDQVNLFIDGDNYKDELLARNLFNRENEEVWIDFCEDAARLNLC